MAVRQGDAMLSVRMLLVAGFMVTGCATSNSAQKMIHPDYGDNILVTERNLAIDRCRQENTSVEFVAYQNEASTDNARGLAQQSRRVSQMAAMNEAMVACMRHNGWRF